MAVLGVDAVLLDADFSDGVHGRRIGSLRTYLGRHAVDQRVVLLLVGPPTSSCARGPHLERGSFAAYSD